MNDPKQERAGATSGLPENEKRPLASGKLPKGDEAEVDVPGASRMIRRQIERQSAKAFAQGQERGKAEASAMREVAGRLVEANQRAFAIVREIALEKVELVRLELGPAALLVVGVPPGADLAKETITDLSDLLGLPVLVIEKGTKWETKTSSSLEAAGWVRGGPRAVPDVGGAIP